MIVSQVIDIAVNRDYSRVAALWLDMMNECCPGWKPNARWFMNSLKQLDSLVEHKVMTARSIDGKIIGFMTVLVYDDPAMGIRIGQGREFYVMPQYRKSRIAYRLMNAAETWAREMGAVAFEACATAKTIGTWMRHGYVPTRALLIKEA